MRIEGEKGREWIEGGKGSEKETGAEGERLGEVGREGKK